MTSLLAWIGPTALSRTYFIINCRDTLNHSKCHLSRSQNAEMGPMLFCCMALAIVLATNLYMPLGRNILCNASFRM